MYLPLVPSSHRRSCELLRSAGAMMLAAGCAVIDQPSSRSDEPAQSDQNFRSAETKGCVDWFTKLDDTIDRAGVRDAETYRVPGFPYLRVNRFMASFRQQAKNDSNVFTTWVKHLRTLDERARSYEIKNLPQDLLVTLEVDSRSEATTRTNQCANSLTTVDATTASRRRMLVERAQVPDDYDDLRRTVGIYPVFSVAFFEFSKKWQKEAADMFQQTAAGNIEQKGLTRYQPPDNPAPAQRIASILANAKTDELGIPQFGNRETEVLFATFAPVFEIETTGEYDRFGPLRWGARETPEVDVSRPTVYRHFSLPIFYL